MNHEPEITTPEQVRTHEAYQATQEPHRPSWAGIDLDRNRRPGYARLHKPKPFPHAHMPVERQPGKSASPMHGRPNKTMPPVFGTATPLRGVSGLVKKFAYSLPDHYPSHWLLKMFGDRVEFWGYRLKKLLPFIALGWLGSKAIRIKL